MSGTTYSRTGGTSLLPGTWEAVLKFHGPGSVIPVEDRLSWDDATPEQQRLFMQMATQDRMRPPDFLRFNLAQTAGPNLPEYPGAVSSEQGRPADGRLIGSIEQACTRLVIDAERMREELAKFSGPVVLTELPAGHTLYRTVGLTASGAAYGSVTNKLLGDYWEPDPPSTHASIEAWRSATAVKAEWNGDFGYIKVTLSSPVYALAGTAGMQVVDAARNLVLPGGGSQIFIPNLAASAPELVSKIQSLPLRDVLCETKFGEVHE